MLLNLIHLFVTEEIGHTQRNNMFLFINHPLKKFKSDMFPVCEFGLDIATPLHSGPQTVPDDFSLIHNGHAYRFNSTALAHSSLKIFRLLLEDPMCRSLEVAADEKALRFFGDVDSAITRDNIETVLQLAVELEIDSLFVAASVSEALSSLPTAKKIEFAVAGFRAGLSVVQICSQLVDSFGEVLSYFQNEAKKSPDDQSLRNLCRLILRRYGELLGSDMVDRACAVFKLPRQPYVSDNVADRLVQLRSGATRSRSNSRSKDTAVSESDSAPASVCEKLEKFENTNILRGVLRHFTPDLYTSVCGSRPNWVDGCVNSQNGQEVSYIREFAYDPARPFDGILANVAHEICAPDAVTLLCIGVTKKPYAFREHRVFPTRIVARFAPSTDPVTVMLEGKSLCKDNASLKEASVSYGPSDLGGSIVTAWGDQTRPPGGWGGVCLIYKSIPIDATEDTIINVEVPESTRDWYHVLVITTPIDSVVKEFEIYGYVSKETPGSRNAVTDDNGNDDDDEDDEAILARLMLEGLDE